MMTRVITSERNVIIIKSLYCKKKTHFTHFVFTFHQSGKQRELATAAKGPDVFLRSRQRPELS